MLIEISVHFIYLLGFSWNNRSKYCDCGQYNDGKKTKNIIVQTENYSIKSHNTVNAIREPIYLCMKWN